MADCTALAYEMMMERKQLMLLSKALKAYIVNGKTTAEFADDYGCDIIRDSDNQIKDIKFHNDSNKTAFMLKYDT